MFMTKGNIASLNKMILVFLFCSILLICQVGCQENTTEKEAESTYDKDFDEVQGIRLKHMDGIEKLLSETDMTYFAYYYKRTSRNSRLGAELLKSISKKLLYLANIIMIDCDTIEPRDTPMCEKDPEAADGFPRMEVYTPPEYKYNPYTKQINTHVRKMYDTREVSENLIYNFITKNISARSIKLNNENFDNFINNLDFNKVILFTDKARTPLLFRGISNYFYDRLIFGEVDKDQTALIRKFKVTKFPTLIVYQTLEDEVPLDEPMIHYFKKEVNAGEIVNFIGEFSLKEPLSVRAKKGPDSLRYKVIFKNLNRNDILNYFSRFNARRFVVYLNDRDEVPEDLTKFNMMTNGFFHFVNINCKNDTVTENFCKTTFKADEIPSLLLYKNTDKDMKKSLEKAPIYLPLDYYGIERELYKEYYGNLKEGNPQTFSAITNEARINKKVPFIYLHEGDIPLGLNLLSTEERYLKYIDFVVYEHPSKDFLKNLQIKKLPQLIILLQDQEKADQARILNYNEELVYSRLGNFINQYFNTEKNTKITEEVEEVKQDIPLISDEDTLNKYCVKGKKKLCIIGFLDGRFSKDSVKQFDNSIRVLENVATESQKKSRPATFGWVNATCHTQLAADLNINIESIPNLIAYVPSKNLYANLIGTFDEETINSFIDKLIQGKVSMNNIKKENFVLSDIKCEELKESTDKGEDDELLREIIEEEKKKREEFEKERASLEEPKKKRRKKRKSEL